MDFKPGRRFTNRARGWAVDRQHQDIAVISAKSHVLHDDRLRKSPYAGPRNSMVWMSKQSGARASPDYQPRKNPTYGSKNPSVSVTGPGGSRDSGTPRSQDRVCKFWMSGNCVKSERCRFLHSWSRCPGLGMLTVLKGHKKDVKGIALPLGSDKLYSVSGDGTLCLWDCHTGQCVHVIDLGAEAGSLICEGPWVFIGLQNSLTALNIQSGAEFNLQGPVGQVNAITVGNDMLFAGATDGVITVWKGNTETNPFKYAASLKGHTGPVMCFIVGAQRLYSGSRDCTIRVWDLNNLHCTMTLKGHSDAVTSLLCWDQYLLSCSLDQTIKGWATAEDGSLEVIYTHDEEHGALSLCGTNDAEAKPIMFCSCNNKTVYVYDLPSFEERGRIFSTHGIRALHVAPGGLFFTGDESGKLTVWNFSNTSS